MIFPRDDLKTDDPKPTALYSAVAASAAANTWTSINGFASARSYSSAGEEYEAATTDAAVADFGPVIRYALRGADAGALLARATSVPAQTLEAGESGRGLMLDENGFVVDFVEGVRLTHDLYLLATTRRHARRMQLAARGFAAAAEEITASVAALLILGPNAREASARAGIDLPAHGAAQRRVRGVELSARTIRFGALAGVEIIYPYSEALTLWERLRRARRLTPIGLDALEIIRIEGGMPRPGVDFIGADEARLQNALRQPDELGMSHLAPADKGWFNGRRALAARPGSARKLVVLKIDADAASPGDSVLIKKGPVGRLTSVAFSPRLKQVVAFADIGPAAVGKPLEIALAGEQEMRAEATVLDTPEARLALAYKLATEKRASPV